MIKEAMHVIKAQFCKGIKNESLVQYHIRCSLRVQLGGTVMKPYQMADFRDIVPLIIGASAVLSPCVSSTG